MNKSEYDYLTRLKSDYKAYCFHTNNEGVDFETQEPRWKLSKFHRYLCDLVQEFIERKTNRPYDILLISVPPQHGKSVTITETLPSFYLGHNPTHKVVEISYGDNFARRFGQRNKEKINRYGKVLFGIELGKAKKSDVDWELSNGIGRMLSKGVGGTITGESANLIIIDDPIKNSEKANSQVERDKLYQEWLGTISTRIAVGGKVIVIQTRWHEDDLYGNLMDNNLARAVNLPAICDENDDPLGREVGEALCPEMGRTKAWLEGHKRSLQTGEVDEGGETGLRTWNAMYQGRPTAKEGNLLKREWWQLYDEKAPVDYEQVILSVDTAFKGNETSDFVVVQAWGKKGANFYLIDMVREHLNFQATMNVIRQRKALNKASIVLIEDKANGTAIIDTMRSQITGIIGVVPKLSKQERCHDISWIIEGGNVYLPQGKPWTQEFIEECSAFPQGKHDDMVDAMTQALTRMLGMKAPKKKNYSYERVKKTKFSLGEGETVNVI